MKPIRCGGFSLIEIVLSLLILMAAVFLIPAFIQQLVFSDMLWERRLAVRFIDTKLEEACNTVRTPEPGFGFNALVSGGIPANTFPPELTSPSGEVNVACVNGNTLSESGLNPDGSCPAGAELKRVLVTVDWTLRGGHLVTQGSPNHWISKAGLCGTGA